MAKKIMQFRYYGDEDVYVSKNQPAANKADYYNNNDINVFKNYTSIIQLGIQTIPGVKFYLNKNNNTPIIIGSTGIYELDLSDTSTAISGIRFDRASMDLIDTMSTGYLIVDILYDESAEV